MGTGVLNEMATAQMEGSSLDIPAPQDVEKCAQLKSILERDVQIIPEETLRKISQGPMKSFILDSKEYLSIAHLWDAILQTFQAANISSSHRAAVCNALCGFLEAARASQDHSVQKFPLSGDVWLSALRAYWARFEEGKSRPMRQVLVTLTKILRDHPTRAVAEDIARQVINEVTSSLVLTGNRSKLRAFIFSLEFFLRKDAISMASLLSAVETWLVKNHETWVTILEHDCLELSIPAARFSNSYANGDSWDGDIRGFTAQIFTLVILHHAVNPDFAPTVGLLLSTMSRRLNKTAETEPSYLNGSWNFRTSWIPPLKYIILQNLEAIEIMSNHILYPLFNADHRSFHSFIKTLPIQAFLVSGVITDVSPEEFTLLFSTLQVAKEIGLVHADRALTPSSIACYLHLTLRSVANRSIELADTENFSSQESVVLDSRRIGQFIGHQRNSIRISALSLLITAPSTTKPLTLGSLEALRDNLPFIHPDPDPYTRGEVFNMIRKLIIRLRGGMSASQKMVVHSSPCAEALPTSTGEAEKKASVTVEDQHAFLRWYIGFLQFELRPTASYQGHISALKVLELVLKSGVDERIDKTNLSKLGQDQTPWVRNLDIFSAGLFKALVDLLLDPFDDVRAACLAILNLFPMDFIRSTPESRGSTTASCFSTRLFHALCRAEDIASLTSRADHADTVARLFFSLFVIAQDGETTKTISWYQNKPGIVEALLSKLEQKLFCKTGLVSSKMRDQPLHGYISALRYIVGAPHFYGLVSDPEDSTFRRWQLFHKRILSLCDRIWMTIKDVLCVDSPEGHTENSSEDSIVGPKDILSYSWRALRESSLLLHAILSNETYAPERGVERLTLEDFDKIGTLSFTQLAELRHRGAFSAVSQTFATCCQCCGKSKESAVFNLPAAWYQNALKIIDDQASQLTRRSAGLPALISAIASSDPGGPLFRKVMHELHDISRQPVLNDKSENMTKLPQVHAMNCLKDIFTSTKLRQSTEAFIMSALIISAECLDSTIWAIRNCGLMLFRALMQRMSRATPGSQGFGDSLSSKASLRIHFKKYPGLIPVLKRLLEPDPSTSDSLRVTSSMSTSRTEQVFPALELISEKVPSAEDDHTLSELVILQTQSSVWAIREQAARASAFLLNRREDIIPNIKHLANNHRLDRDQNHLHGTLLCIRYSLQKYRAFSQGNIDDHLRRTSAICEEVFRLLSPATRSPFVQAALIDILNDVIEDGIASGNDTHVLSLIDAMAWGYGLYDALDKTLTSTDGINTHSSTLLRRALGLTTQVSLLLEFSEPQALFSLIDQVSNADPDAAQWILHECHQFLGHNRRLWCQNIKLYVNILTKTHAEKVKTAATSNLVDILESFLESGPSALSEVNTTSIWAQLVLLPNRDSRISIWGRDMVDSDLRLHGCILAFQSLSPGGWNLVLQDSRFLKAWCLRLRFAIQDETEFTTRYSAVASMKSFIQTSHASRPPVEAEPFLLDIYLILYDMLNDDDEELRDISAIAASYVLANRQGSPAEAASTLVPLATSHRLAQFLATSYQTSPHLLHEAIQRLTGQRIKISSFSSMVCVSALLDEHIRNSTVLFVEEKQNLFIDDAREARVWHSVLKQLKPETKAIDSALAKEFPQWVSDGLSCLTKTTELETAGGLLGFTSKPEVFIIGLRVIYAASVLLSKGLSVGFDVDERLISARATQLLEVGRAAWVHEQWLSCLHEALHDITLK